MTYIGTLAQYEYEPYGGAFQFSGPTPDLGFTGHRWDAEAGMYYAPYRMYDPDIMRWISTDPAGMVDGPNTYRYVGSSPAQYIDELGLLKIGGIRYQYVGRMLDWVRTTWIGGMCICSFSCVLHLWIKLPNSMYCDFFDV